MTVVETERNGQVLIVRMNRPESLNALNTELRQKLAETWTEFRASKELEVAIFTGAGRAFCAGEDMKESLAKRQTDDPGPFHGRLAGEAGDCRHQRFRDARRLHAGGAYRFTRRRSRGVVRSVRGEALAARRLQSWPSGQCPPSRPDGKGAWLPIYRRTAL